MALLGLVIAFTCSSMALGHYNYVPQWPSEPSNMPPPLPPRPYHHNIMQSKPTIVQVPYYYPTPSHNKAVEFHIMNLESRLGEIERKIEQLHQISEPEESTQIELRDVLRGKMQLFVNIY